MTTATKKLPIRDHVEYPDSDGKPMGETARHVKNLRIALDIVAASWSTWTLAPWLFSLKTIPLLLFCGLTDAEVRAPEPA